MHVSRPGRGRTAQSLYALKLRATIIGYVPPLVVYGSSLSQVRHTYCIWELTYPPLGLLGFFLYIFLRVCYVYARLLRVAKLDLFFFFF